jgi:hypothetical protein
MPTECLTPVGRIVWGHPGKSQTKKDQRDRKTVILKDGQPVQQWAFGLAIPKNDFNAQVWPLMDREIRSAFPNGPPQGFANKLKDGDGVDRQGKPYNIRPGYAGCWVMNIATEAFAPPLYKIVNNVYVQMQPDELKCGDFAAANLNFQVNVPTNPTHSPSLYVNPRGIIFVGYGDAIVQTADPSAMFGAQPPQFQLPPGASLTPTMPQNAPGMPGSTPAGPGGYPQPGPGQMQPGGYPQPGPGQMQPGGYPQPGPGQMQPGGYPQPARDFVQNAGMQQPGPGGYAPQGGPISTGPMPGPGQQQYYPQPGQPGGPR